VDATTRWKIGAQRSDSRLELGEGLGLTGKAGQTLPLPEDSHSLDGRGKCEEDKDQETCSNGHIFEPIWNLGMALFGRDAGETWP
jgi:hypothetical protein